MSGNVVMDGELEVPFSDEQIELLEESEAIAFVEWQDAEAVYFVTEAWEDGCKAIGAHPMQAICDVITFNSENA